MTIQLVVILLFLLSCYTVSLENYHRLWLAKYVKMKRNGENKGLSVMLHKMLVVEKNRTYCTQLVQIFRHAGYNVHAVGTKLDGIAFFLQNEYDMILASAAVDDTEMLGFLMRMKELKSTIKTGMIMYGPSDDLLLAVMEGNIDFYFQKRVSVLEVFNQWEQMLCTSKVVHTKRKQTLYVAEDKLLVDLSAHVAYKDQKCLCLNMKEYQLLVCLLKNKGTALSRLALYKVMYRNQEKVGLRLVDKYVENLRNKLGTNSIISIRGYGYKWQI